MPNEVRNSKFLVLENYKKIFDIGSKLMRSVISAFLVLYEYMKLLVTNRNLEK